MRRTGGRLGIPYSAWLVTFCLVVVTVYAVVDVLMLLSRQPERLAQFNQPVLDNCTGYLGCGVGDSLLTIFVVVLMAIAVSYVVSIYKIPGGASDE